MGRLAGPGKTHFSSNSNLLTTRISSAANPSAPITTVTGFPERLMMKTSACLRGRVWHLSPFLRMADREGILGFDGPGAVMFGEADFGIILDGFRRRQQDEHRSRSHLLSGLLNQLNADAFPLVRYPHRKVGQVTD